MFNCTNLYNALVLLLMSDVRYATTALYLGTRTFRMHHPKKYAMAQYMNIMK